MKPHFVEAKVMKDGSVRAVDDQGEIFHLEMFRGRAWPMLSREMRRFELLEPTTTVLERVTIPPLDPPPPKPTLKLVT